MNEIEIKPGHAYALRVTERKDEDGMVRMPTEFIGEITLCKDCVKSCPYEHRAGYVWCTEYECVHKENWFCADGVPREDWM